MKDGDQLWKITKKYYVEPSKHVIEGEKESEEYKWREDDEEEVSS